MYDFFKIMEFISVFINGYFSNLFCGSSKLQIFFCKKRLKILFSKKIRYSFFARILDIDKKRFKILYHSIFAAFCG